MNIRKLFVFSLVVDSALEISNMLTCKNDFTWTNILYIFSYYPCWTNNVHSEPDLHHFPCLLTHSPHLYTQLRSGKAAHGTRRCWFHIVVLGNRAHRCNWSHRGSHGNCRRWDMAVIDTHQYRPHRWPLWISKDTDDTGSGHRAESGNQKELSCRRTVIILFHLQVFDTLGCLFYTWNSSVLYLQGNA